MRTSESRPVVEHIERALIKLKASGRYLPQSLTGTAVDYALGQWRTLEIYLADGQVEIDNNLVENAIVRKTGCSSARPTPASAAPSSIPSWFVHMRKIVGGRRRGSAQAGKQSRLQPQSIVNIIEADAVGQLREEHGHDMAPRCKGSGFLSHFGGASNLGNQKLRNQIANLPQQVQL